MNWHPIETAPKDGSFFLCNYVLTYDEYDEDDQVIARNKRERFSCIASVDPVFGLQEFPWDRRSAPSYTTNKRYTHWMPLPEAPK